MASELYLNDPEMQTVGKKVIGDSCSSACDRYGLLSKVDGVGGDFSQTRLKGLGMCDGYLEIIGQRVSRVAGLLVT